MTLRLLHVVPTYLPATRYGGPIYAVHGLCKALAAQGHDVHVFTTNVDGPEDSPVPIERPVDLDGVKVWYFPSHRLRRLYRSPKMGGALKKHLKTFDLVHLHSVFLWPTWKAAREADAAGVPYVLSPRGMLVRDLIRRRNKLIKQLWIHLIERKNLRNAALIHVTSGPEEAGIRDLGLDLAPVSIVANGVDVPGEANSEEPDDDIKNACRLQPDILYLGRINWKKGLERLIECVEPISDAKVVIAGNDEEDHASKLRRLVAASELDARIRIVDRFVSGASKEALLAAAKIFVLPSLSENFGNVVLEAMMRGKPVIVSRDVGAADIVERSNAGLVFDGSPKDLASKIQQLLNDPVLSQSMGQAGAKAAREHYRWSTIAEEMTRLYQTVVKPFGGVRG